MKSSRMVWNPGLASAIVASVLALAACAPGGAKQSAAQRPQHPLPIDTMTVALPEVGRYGGRFVLGQTTSPKGFNPTIANESSTSDVTSGRLFASLVDFDYITQTDLPSLARSWETSPDGLVWTYHLRRGAAFSDGHPLTSEDVLFTFQTVLDDSVPNSVKSLLILDGKKPVVAAPDSYTVVVTWPIVYALANPAVGSVYILPKHVLGAAYAAGEFESTYGVDTPPEKLVTSGPWKLKAYVPNEKTVLEPNPYWFQCDVKGQRLPYLDDLTFVIVPDQNTAALKFESGELDGLDNVKPEDYSSFESKAKTGGFVLHDVGVSLYTNFMWFNLNTYKKAEGGNKVGSPRVDPIKYAWFKERDFRRAVSHAIDRQAIIAGPFFNEAVENYCGSTVANKYWHIPDLPHAGYDPDRARALLAGLGYKDRDGDGFLEDAKGHTITFTVKTNSDNNVRIAMGNLIKDDLAKVGIKMNFAPADFNTLINNMRQDFKYDAIMLGLQSAVPPDPGMGQNVWRSTGRTHYWNMEQKHPESPEEAHIDELMTANIGATDLPTRLRAWREIQTIVNDQVYMVWLPSQKTKLPVRAKFGNMRPSVIPHRLLWAIHTVFVKG